MTITASNLIPAMVAATDVAEFIASRPLSILDRGAGIMIRVKSPALRASWESISQPSWDGWCDEVQMGGFIVPPEMQEKLRQWLLEIRVER